MLYDAIKCLENVDGTVTVTMPGLRSVSCQFHVGKISLGRKQGSVFRISMRNEDGQRMYLDCPYDMVEVLRALLMIYSSIRINGTIPRCNAHFSVVNGEILLYHPTRKAPILWNGDRFQWSRKYRKRMHYFTE